MRPVLRALVILLAFFNFHAAFAQGGGVDTILGCDEIPPTPQAGASCTICNFQTLYGFTTIFTPSPDAGWCGTIENDQYIGFVAGPTGAVTFEITTFNCTNGDGVQVGIYDQNNSLVGDCFNQVFPNQPQVFTGGGLTPGEVYYMRIDGFAGDNCEFTITVISGLSNAPPDPPGPIMGPRRVCWDDSYSWFIDMVPNATSYYWRVTRGVWTAAATVDPPEAENPLEGTTGLSIEVTLPEMPIAMPPGTCDTVLLEVFPLNTCFPGTDSSAFEFIVCRPDAQLDSLPVCAGGEVEYPPGSGEFYGYSPIDREIVIGTDRFGCDTTAILRTTLETGIFIQDSVVLCEGEVFDGCGFPDPSIPVPSVTTCVVPPATGTGCDTTFVWYIFALDPQAHIEATNGTISCTNATDELFAVTRTGSIPPSSAGDTVSYQWFDASNAPIGTGESVVISEPGTYTLEVTMTSNADPNKSCTETTTITITDTRTAPNPPSVAGDFDVCADEVPQTYTASGATGSDQYLWSVTPATGATSSSSGATLTVTDFGTLSTLTVCAQTFNACDTSTATCEVITINPLPTPATLTGPTELCEGTAGTYVIGGYDASLTYTVSSSPTGSTATVNGGNIDFTMGTAAGDLCLEVSNSCGTLSPVCVSIALLPEPVATAPTGPTNVCIGDEEDYVIYTSLPQNTTAVATVTGGNIVADNGGSITVEWTDAGTQSVCVVYTNSCGDSDPACLDVTVSSAGSAILSGGGDYCAGNNDVEVTITFVGAGPYEYTYTLDGATVTGTATSSPVVITNPTPGDYVLTGFTVAQCAGTVSGTANVSELTVPTAALQGGGQLCTGVDTTLEITFTGDGPWTFEHALDGTGQGTTTTSDNPYLLTVSAAGQYTLLSVESDNGCVGTVSGSATISVLDPIVIGVLDYQCDPTAENYTVSFTITGGDASSYQVIPASGGSIAGGVFTSNAIPSGDSFVFAIGDGSSCDPVAVTGDNTCPCITRIGDLSTAPIELCGDQLPADVAAGYDPANEVLDGNDVRIYVLHTGTGATITGAIATNTTGSFPFAPPMVYGTTYYVSVVVGNDDGSGGVDLTDDCTLVAPGTPVTFLESPTANLVGGGDICVGADTTVVVDFTGSAPWTIDYTIGGASFTETTSDNPYTINIVGLTTSETVTLTGVATGTCAGTATGTADINVRTGVQVTAAEDCNSTSIEYRVTITITGGDPASYTVLPNTGTLTGNTFISDPITAGAGYTFVITDQYDCDPQVVSSPQVVCDCISDAGTMPSDTITICGPLDATAVIPVDTAMDGDDIQNFILHDGSSNAVGATVFAQQVGPTFSFDPTVLSYGTVYFISAVMGNNVGGATDLTDVCLDVAVGTPVLWLREPTVTISGDQDVCVDDPITIEFDVDADGPVTVVYTNGTTTETITLNPGNTSIPGVPNESGTYTITSVTSGACPGQANGSAVVGVHEPVMATAVPTCNSTATEYTIEITITGGDPATYVVTPNTGTLVGNVFTSAPIDASVGYVFTVTDQWGCTPVVLQDDVDCDCLTRIGSITDNFVSCDQTELATFVYDATGEFLDGDDAVEYILHTGNPNTPLLRSATPEFGFDGTLMTAGTTYFVTAVAGNATGGTVDLADACTVFSNTLEVVWGDPPVVALSGDFTECPGVAVNLTFDVTGPGNITIVYSDGTTQWTEILTAGISQVPFPQATEATYSIVSVTSDACAGTFSGSASLTLLDGPSVGTPQVTINATGTQYEAIITISGGDPATYTVNGTPLGGATTFSSGPINCGTPWTYTVDDAGGCDPVTGTVDPNCNCLSAVGALSGPFSSCDETEVANLNYDPTGENLDGDDALQFILYLNDLASPIARSTTPSFGFDATTMVFGTVYNIAAVVGNAVAGEVDLGDGCLAVDGPITAVWYESPNATMTGPVALCAGDDLELTFNVTGSASAKTVNFTVDGVAQSLSGIVPGTPGIFSTSASGTVAVVLTSVEDANCTTPLSETLTVDIATDIVISNLQETCNPTNTEYVVTFEISGGDPASYVVSPAGSGAITGTGPYVFTSNPIASGDLYTFTVTDASACSSPSVSDDPRCDCLTEAGEMLTLSQISVCAGDDINVDFNTGTETLDPNDVLWFALRTDNDAIDYTDDVVQVNTAPSFSSVGLTPGTVYYVSPVAADGLTDGSLDNSDDCLDIGLSTPVFIQELPSGMLTGDTVICETGSATITLVLVGNGPFDVNIDRGDAGGDTLITGAVTGQTFQVDPVTGTVYFLSNITDNSVPQCSSQPNSNVTIGVEDLLTAGLAAEPLELCEGSGDLILLDDRITDGDVGGTWTQTAGPSAGSNFDPTANTVNNSTLDPGTYEFTYTVGSGFPCPTDAEPIVVDIEAGPEADAGLDQEITCDEPVVQLGADPVAGYTYEWTGGALSDPTASAPTTSVAGTYILTVTSGDAECLGVDEVEVLASDDVPEFDNLQTRDVTCFGDTDGAVFTEVAGGTAPFTYTLDGVATSNVGQFTGLPPGEYELQVVDSEGCAYLDTIIVEAAKEVIVDAGPDVSIDFGESHQVRLYLEGDVETVRWVGDSLQCISTGDLCDEAILYPQTSGTYAVTVRDSNGCEAQDVIQLLVRRERPVFIPNAISPNGDAINDWVYVLAREGVVEQVTNFVIYDRWGEMVYQKGPHAPNIETEGWDGRFRGELLNPQVLTFYVEIEFTDGEIEEFKGDITLVGN